MTDVYDVIPLPVRRRISSAETIWEFFRLPLSPLPPPRPPRPSPLPYPPPPHPCLGLSFPERRASIPPVATGGSHQSPASRQPHELLGRPSVPAHPRTTQGGKQMGGGYGASIKSREKNVRRPETRRGGKNTSGRVCSQDFYLFIYFLFSIIVTFVLKFCHVR